MGIFTGIVLYLLIFSTALFAVLPFGSKPPETVQMGNASSAPDNPRILRKFVITAAVSAVLWLLVFTLIKLDVIDFYKIAQQMTKEDYNE